MGGIPAVLVGYEMERDAVEKWKESKGISKSNFTAVYTLLKELSTLVGSPVQIVYTDEPSASDREGNYAFVCCHVEESMEPTETKDLHAIVIPDGFDNVKDVLGISKEAHIKYAFVPFASTF